VAKSYIPHLRERKEYFEVFEKHSRSCENWLGCELMYVLERRRIPFKQRGVPKNVDFLIDANDYLELKEYHSEGGPGYLSLPWSGSSGDEIPDAIAKLQRVEQGSNKWILVVMNPLTKSEWLAQSNPKLAGYSGTAAASVANHLVEEIKLKRGACVVALLKVI
jgi:hypothetical protein